jgi:hypothetical protein
MHHVENRGAVDGGLSGGCQQVALNAVGDASHGYWHRHARSSVILRGHMCVCITSTHTCTRKHTMHVMHKPGLLRLASGRSILRLQVTTGHCIAWCDRIAPQEWRRLRLVALAAPHQIVPPGPHSGTAQYPTCCVRRFLSRCAIPFAVICAVIFWPICFHCCHNRHTGWHISHRQRSPSSTDGGRLVLAAGFVRCPEIRDLASDGSDQEPCCKGALPVGGVSLLGSCHAALS